MIFSPGLGWKDIRKVKDLQAVTSDSSGSGDEELAIKETVDRRLTSLPVAKTDLDKTVDRPHDIFGSYHSFLSYAFFLLSLILQVDSGGG